MPPSLGKRGLSQPVPDPVIEQPLEPSHIIIIQPGSYNLRLGRAVDSFPHAIPHCIARKHKKPHQQEQYEDPWLLRQEYDHPDAKLQQKAGLRSADEGVRSRPNALGEYRHPTSLKQVYQMNFQSKLDVTDVPSPMNWTNTHHNPESVFGKEALYLHPSDTYNLHWPIRRGKLNLHSGAGGTITSVMQDLEDIWRHAIEKQFCVQQNEFQTYRIVLLIPDVYERLHIKIMVQVLLERLGFGFAFVVQESLCASFCAGVSSACIVDVGDQKTSVCCVDDGLSLKNTRLCMEIGGCDITRCFHWLLNKTGFPYKQCDVASRVDSLFMQELKEKYCHIDLDSTGIRSENIQVKHPEKQIMKFSLAMGDETLFAAMSLFYPDMLGLRGNSLWRTHSKTAYDPDDPHDDEYLMKSQAKTDTTNKNVTKGKKDKGLEEVKEADDSILVDQFDDDDINDPTENGDSLSGIPNKIARKADEEENFIKLHNGLVGIDQAILQCIDKCETDDLKKKMYSCIIIVGGGIAKFQGADSWIKHAVWTQMPPHFRAQLETMDVITKPKDFDPVISSWKGGAILSCFDTAQELWMKRDEWKKQSTKLLRERSPFLW